MLVRECVQGAVKTMCAHDPKIAALVRQLEKQGAAQPEGHGELATRDSTQAGYCTS